MLNSQWLERQGRPRLHSSVHRHLELVQYVFPPYILASHYPSFVVAVLWSRAGLSLTP